MAKTLRSRLAAVAVAALGMGLVQAAPAFAASSTPVITDAVDITVVGTAATSTMTFATSADNQTATLAVTAPRGSSVTLTNGDRAGTDIWARTDGDSTWDSSDGTITDVDSADDSTGTITITPDVPGVYTVTLTTADAAVDTYYIMAKAASASTTSGTASLTASWNATVVQAGEGYVNGSGSYADPILTVTMPAGTSAANNNDIKLKVTRSADTDLPVNTVIGATVGSTVTYGTSATAPTFTLAVAGSGLLASSGLFEFLAFEDSDLNGDYTAGERFVTTSLRLAGAPTTYSVSKTPASAAIGDTVIVDVSFSDGTYATATTSYTITMTAASLDGTKTFATGQALANTGKRRQVLVVKTGTTAGSNTLSFTDSGGITGTAITKSTTLTVNAQSNGTSLAYVAAAGIKPTAAGDVELTPVAGAASVGTITVDLAKTTVYYVAKTTTGGDQVKVTVTPNSSTNTGIVSITGDHYYDTLADGTVSFSVTVTGATAGKGYDITLDGANDMTYTVVYADPGAEWTINPGTGIGQVKGTDTKITGTLKDIFGRVLASKAVSATVAGRNPAQAFTGTTDANGVWSFTIKDTSTATLTAQPTDTVSVTYNYTNVAGTASTATGGTVTVTYAASAVEVDTIVVTEDSDNTETIDQVERVAGEPGALVTYTATVKDADGAAVDDGTIVTFTGGSGDIFYHGISTATTTDGAASVQVYRQKAGYSVITATAGGKSGSNSSVLWSNDPGDTESDGDVATGAADARNVAVSADQSVVAGGAATVTATVTDRWGNPVQGVLVTWSTSGVGRGVSGADTTVGTDANGKAQYQVTSLSTETGAMTITATIGNTGQAVEIAGYVNNTSVAGVTAGNYQASSTVTFTAAPAPKADPTITALTDAVTKMMTALQTQITTMQTSISLLVNSFSATVTKLLNALAKKK